jgi:hypothetical protein
VAVTVVRGIQPREVEAHWPRLAPLIERGLCFAGGCFGLADVRRSLIEGRRQLWVDWPEIRCALVTEQFDYPLKRVLHVFLVAGRLPRDWRAIWAGIERWARSQGCAAVEIRGRPGWARHLNDYRATMIFFSKELAA